MQLQLIQFRLLNQDWLSTRIIRIKVSRDLDLKAGKENTCRRSPLHCYYSCQSTNGRRDGQVGLDQTLFPNHSCRELIAESFPVVVKVHPRQWNQNKRSARFIM